MIKRTDILLKPDPKRVLLQYFFPGNESRAARVINRVLGLDENEVNTRLEKVLKDFSERHREIDSIFHSHYNKIENLVPSISSISEKRKLLIGAYFSKEYSIESAALFNPSIVPHPDQSGMEKGALKFIISLRATGEGHISSIEFRSGTADSANNIRLDQTTRFVKMASQREEGVVQDTEPEDANYNISFSGTEQISERVIFPYSRSEQNGIEDVRFVQFTENDGSTTYFGTFTAYDGHKIQSQLIQTDDFVNFKIRTISGDSVRDKGMALFPKKINNKYAIISRLDGENLFFMESDNIYRWNSAQVIREPQFDWEFVQIGNCGSPVETDDGWILLTHGVGPVRTYVVSALLLDKKSPSKIIGYLKEPLLQSDEKEREGYVPNVVYSCGGIIHNRDLIIPYAMSDSASSFALVNVNDLLKNFISC